MRLDMEFSDICTDRLFLAYFATTLCISKAHSKDPAPGDKKNLPASGSQIACLIIYKLEYG